AERVRAAVADDVAAHVAARGLDPGVGLALGLELLRAIPEVALIGLLDLVERDAQDLDRLAPLLDADPPAVPGVAVRAHLALADRDAELALERGRAVEAVGLVATEV